MTHWRKPPISNATISGIILGALVAGMLLGVLIAVLTGVAARGAEQRQEQRRYYDDRGRSTGTSSKDSEGNVTFRDARGNVVGKSAK